RKVRRLDRQDVLSHKRVLAAAGAEHALASVKEDIKPAFIMLAEQVLQGFPPEWLNVLSLVTKQNVIAHRRLNDGFLQALRAFKLDPVVAAPLEVRWPP